ncbi:hypothetical protein Fmac_012756 [Flemingia macrophylla]|uniref:gibberellin 3beta-dioxygenase n=1 Tax=Flemingia macrophylla TaxID=520843 RepID=A0ABD1MR61_9FABA
MDPSPVKKLAYKSNPNGLDNQAPIDLRNIQSVPEAHTWEKPEPHTITMESIPVIDITDPNAKLLIGEACEKWGAFQAINHGIPSHLFDKAEAETFRLFNLPHDHKLRVLRGPDDVLGYGIPRIQRYFPKFMWSEGFTIEGSPAQHASELWPDQPHIQTAFCTTMEECQKEMKRATESVMELIFGALGLGPKDEKWPKSKMGDNKAQALLALNSYPMCPEPDRAMGLGPHTDTSFVTVVHQSSCTGLQLLKEGVGWVPVKPVRGALVVNVGDLLHILSNGRFHSVFHRAVVNNEKHRVSIAYVYGPPSDVKIAPAPTMIDQEHPPLYSPVTWNHYIYAKSIHHNNALEYVKHRVQ